MVLGMTASKGEARRLIAGGGARIDGASVSDENLVISASSSPIKISAGKKKHGLLHFI
jgi:tyrosyl-tRNA synthetase